MSEALEKLAALPLEVEFHGRRFKLAPLSLGQIAAIEKWCRLRPFEEIDAKLAAVKDKRVRERLEPKLTDDAIAAAKDPAQLSAAMDSMECLVRQFRMMLEKHQPGMTDAEVGELVDLAGIRTLRKWVSAALEVGKPPGNPPTPGPVQTPTPTGPNASGNSPGSTE